MNAVSERNRVDPELAQFDTCLRCGSNDVAWLLVSYPPWARREHVEYRRWEMFCRYCSLSNTFFEHVAAQPGASIGDIVRAHFRD